MRAMRGMKYHLILSLSLDRSVPSALLSVSLHATWPCCAMLVLTRKDGRPCSCLPSSARFFLWLCGLCRYHTELTLSNLSLLRDADVEERRRQAMNPP